MTDKAAVWFEILEELGERPMMSFAHYNKESKQVSWQELPHKEYDGVGAFYHLVENVGLNENEVNVKFSPQRKPKLLEKIKSLFHYHPESKLRHTNWNDFERLKKDPPLRSCISLDEEEFKSLKANAKKSRGTIDSFVLHNLDRLINENYQKPNEERWWMVPINMRSANNITSRENNSSYISLQLKNETSVRDINSQMIDKLKKYTHWAAWFWMVLFQKLGRGFVKGALEYFDKNSHGWTGIYTSINYEVLKENEFFKDNMLIGIAPVTKAHPIALDLVSSNGYAVLGLKSHSGLMKDQNEIDSFLNKLKESILRNI